MRFFSPVSAGVLRDEPAPRHLQGDRDLTPHGGLYHSELLLAGPADEGGEHAPPLLRHTEPAGGNAVAPPVRGESGSCQQQRENAA